MSKKIKADNVEQLMEIVKAIQNGEEPDEALRKKRAESAPVADSPKSRSKLFARLHRSAEEDQEDGLPVDDFREEDSEDQINETAQDMPERRTQGEKADAGLEKREFVDDFRVNRADEEAPSGQTEEMSSGHTEEADADEFDRILDEDGESSFNMQPVLDVLAGGVHTVTGTFQSLKERAAGFAQERAAARKEAAEKAAREAAEKEAEKAAREAAEKAAEEAAEKAAEEAAEKAAEEAAGKAAEKTAAEGTEKAAEAAAGEAVAEADKDSAKESSGASEDKIPDSYDSDMEDSLNGNWKRIPHLIQKNREAGAAAKDTAAGKASDIARNIAGGKAADTDKAADADITSAQDNVTDTDQSDGQKKTAGQDKAAKSGAGVPITDRLHAVVRSCAESLEQKGLHRKELVMLAMGAALVLLILVLVVNGISTSFEQKEKSQNVTADEHLTITVEQEPDAWCSHADVILKIRANGASVSSVTINGQRYTPDENDLVELDAEDYLLEVSVTTEDGTLSGQVEIPMIDAQAPVLTLDREQEQIVANAVDARSTVEGIYYAAVMDDSYIDLPEYQLYQGPLTYEEDTLYYFYAKDQAGNCSDPVVTTTETAESLVLASEELSLFPGETADLGFTVWPDGALLNDLSFESANTGVVTVDAFGQVTAVGEGSTRINVSADGVQTVSCTVEVSSERTVTISTIGDCTLGTDASFNTTTNFDAFAVVNGTSYFFQNVQEILEQDDATFANLEGPLTTETTAMDKEFAFKGDPSYTEILQNGSVDVVTLANNHSSDYGTQSLEDTKNYLTEAGIDYCQDDEIVVKDVNGISTAFIGIYELNEGVGCQSRTESAIADARAQGAELIVVAFHWGTEKATTPDDAQRTLAHAAIDAGADLVVGHHPHVLQGIELYNGKYIVYSLGNFCFGGNSSPSDMDTIIFRQTFTITEDGVQDEAQAEVIPCSISSADGYNNYQPTPATGTEAERIMEKLNERSSEFGQTFEAANLTGQTEQAGQTEQTGQTDAE